MEAKKMKCTQCGREFKNDLALKIHIGRMHGSKAKKAKDSAKTSFKCSICGRSFGMPAHLARHVAATHGRGKKARPAARRASVRAVGRALVRAVRKPSLAAGARVLALTIDQLVDLKNAVDARLAAIAQQLRKAKIEV